MAEQNAQLLAMLDSFLGDDASSIVMSYAKIKSCDALPSCRTVVGCNHESIASFACQNHNSSFARVTYRALISLKNYQLFPAAVFFHLGAVPFYARFSRANEKFNVAYSVVITINPNEVLNIVTHFPVQCIVLENEHWDFTTP